MSLYRLQALIHQKVTLLILVVARSCHHFLLFHADKVLEVKEEAADLETLLRQEREREKARHEKDLPVEVGLLVSYHER